MSDTNVDKEGGQSMLDIFFCELHSSTLPSSGPLQTLAAIALHIFIPSILRSLLLHLSLCTALFRERKREGESWWGSDAAATVRDGVHGCATDAVRAADTDAEPIRGVVGGVRQGGRHVFSARVPADPARGPPDPRRRLPLVDLITLLPSRAFGEVRLDP